MIFVTGGRAQGKTAFACRLLRESGRSREAVRAADGRDCPFSDIGACDILTHLECLVRRALQERMDTDALLEVLLSEDGPDIICADEIGLGIVPADREERLWRDEAGRAAQKTAAAASEVYRIICGIPQCLKRSAGEEEPCL